METGVIKMSEITIYDEEIHLINGEWGYIKCTLKESNSLRNTTGNKFHNLFNNIFWDGRKVY
jgi:hypothetical protein